MKIIHKKIRFFLLGVIFKSLITYKLWLLRGNTVVDIVVQRLSDAAYVRVKATTKGAHKPRASLPPQSIVSETARQN